MSDPRLSDPRLSDLRLSDPRYWRRREYWRRKQEQLCVSCGQPNQAVPTVCCERCRQKQSSNRKGPGNRAQKNSLLASRSRARMQTLEAYGGAVCACCGESGVQFLTLHHVNGDGAVERRHHGSRLAYWLRRQGYPPGYEVLCFNCNVGKHLNGGVCPHEWAPR